MLSRGYGTLRAFRHQGERWGSLSLTPTYTLSAARAAKEPRTRTRRRRVWLIDDSWANRPSGLRAAVLYYGQPHAVSDVMLGLRKGSGSAAPPHIKRIRDHQPLLAPDLDHQGPDLALDRGPDLPQQCRSAVGWGDEGTPTIGGRGGWSSFLTLVANSLTH
jgi:hypothetical protein